MSQVLLFVHFFFKVENNDPNISQVPSLPAFSQVYWTLFQEKRSLSTGSDFSFHPSCLSFIPFHMEMSNGTAAAGSPACMLCAWPWVGSEDHIWIRPRPQPQGAHSFHASSLLGVISPRNSVKGTWVLVGAFSWPCIPCPFSCNLKVVLPTLSVITEIREMLWLNYGSSTLTLQSRVESASPKGRAFPRGKLRKIQVNVEGQKKLIKQK